jgi:hypothetical protein
MRRLQTTPRLTVSGDALGLITGIVGHVPDPLLRLHGLTLLNVG